MTITKTIQRVTCEEYSSNYTSNVERLQKLFIIQFTVFVNILLSTPHICYAK